MLDFKNSTTCCNLYAAVSLTWPKFFFLCAQKKKTKVAHLPGTPNQSSCDFLAFPKMGILLWCMHLGIIGATMSISIAPKSVLVHALVALGVNINPFPMGMNVFECMHLHPSCKHGMGPQRFILVERPRPWCEVESSMGLILPENPSSRGFYWV